MSIHTRLPYLVAALLSLLIWLGAWSWTWSRDDCRLGYFPEAATAVMAVASLYAPYYLLLKLARRARADPEGLLLWWTLAAPLLAMTLFIGVIVGLPDACWGSEPLWHAVLPPLLVGIGKHGLLLATIYGYTGFLLLKLPPPPPRAA